MKPARQHGIALIEALLAVLLLGIGLLGTIGLQARSYSALTDAGMRAEATIAAEQLLGVMNTDLANLAAYELTVNGTLDPRLTTWFNDTRTRIPGAIITVHVTPVAGTSRSQVDIEIDWKRKAGDQMNKHKVTSYIAGAT
jgi:type IV pilus assembly protein PilV